MVHDYSKSIFENTEKGYNYGKYNNTQEDRGSYSDFCQYISQKIREYEEKTGDRITRKDIAEKTGISYEMVKKIISQNKHSQKRDAIIAICACLLLNQSQTNVALDLYEFCSLSPYNERDVVISTWLDCNEKTNSIDETLKSCGMAPLNVTGDTYSLKQKHPRTLNTEDSEKHGYEVLSIGKYTHFIPDIKCICFEYMPEFYTYDTDMKLRDVSGQEYNLHLFSKDNGIISRIDSDGKSVDSKLIRLGENNTYESGELIEPELMIRIKQLQYFIDQQAQLTLAMLDDTRNYSYRIDMYIKDAKLVIYGEIFNHYYPEAGEYYQISINGSKHSVSMSNRSIFLREYLDTDYEKYYDPKYKPKVSEYLSLEELIRENSTENIKSFQDYWRAKAVYNGTSPFISYERTKCFNELHSAIKNTIVEIRNGRKTIFTDPSTMATLKNTEEVFESVGIDCDQLIFDNEHETLPNGMTVTAADMYTAEALGINMPDGMMEILEEHGSLDGFFEAAMESVSFTL